MNAASDPIRAAVDPVATWTPASDGAATFRYVDIGSVDRETKTVVDVAVLPVKDAPSRARQLLRAGDVLVSTVRPNLNAVAMVPAELDGAVGSTGFTVLRAKPKRLLPRYLFHWVRSPIFVADMVRKATGASYPAISDRIVMESAIPMPDVDEQRRIADILDKADAIRRKRKQAIALTEDLLRSAFLDMFGDPVTNPKGWDVTPLGELGDLYSGGTPSRARVEFFDGDIPWATAKDFKADLMSDTQEHVSERAVEASATKMVPPGTVLVVVKSKILMRRLPVAVASVPLCFNQDVKGLVPHAAFESAFIASHLRLAERQMLKLARGVNTEGLTVGHLRGHAVMRPPEHLVKKYSEFDSRARINLQRHGGGLRDAEALFQSVMVGAFSASRSEAGSPC